MIEPICCLCANLANDLEHKMKTIRATYPLVSALNLESLYQHTQRLSLSIR